LADSIHRKSAVLRWRLFVAAIILVPLIAALVADYRANFGIPGLWLIPVGLTAAMLATAEMLAMLKGKGHRPVAWAVYAGVAGIYLATSVPTVWPLLGSEYPANCPLGKLGWPLAATAAALALSFIAEMQRYKEPGGVLVNVALAFLTTAYIGLSMSFLAALRFFESNEWGSAAVISLIVVIKISDTGAYAFGRMFGRHKLAPQLSPGKTVEGAIGGLITACVASWLYFDFIVPRLVGSGAVQNPWWAYLVYGAVLAVAGLIGDLAESLIKRDLGCKDSSRWIPGLGGVLDLLDSLLLGAPAAYLCWAAGLVGPG
jgi:phosphatidate cytidylyltransferase